ncbi:unnamed protein product [Somion occarium]|uniref:Uncharacterized protein n=1 Tax=Somion occarium TaxID=3059160 RepID=A0ABP1CZW2_9APHY
MLSASSRAALQELPLEQFLVPPDSNLTVTPSKRTTRSNKRPRSPAVPSSCSPVKRRILCEESLVSPTFRSPFSSNKSGRFSPSRFHELLLQGPDSPVKKLDFGKGEENVESVFPSGMKVSVLSRRSPRNTTPLRSAAASKSKASTPKFSSRHPTYRTSKSSPGDIKMEDSFSPFIAKAPSPRPSPPLTIPRKVARPDPHSIHYPGFDVHLDPYDYVPKASATALTDDMDDGSDLPAEKAKRAKEADKENIPPRRRTQKLVVSTEASSKGELLPPFEEVLKSGQNTPVSGTPRAKRVRELTGVSDTALVFTLPSPRVLDGRGSSIPNLLKGSGRGF